MDLTQLMQVKRWLLLHAHYHPVELGVWNLVLVCWLLGWVAVPGALLAQQWAALPLCLLGFTSPNWYVGGRKRLHRAGRLRCDWLTAL
ncbi:hypothetical protein RQP53_04025 [Paucibacter sp. APW11]|uniref:Fatty acid desaturase domain-containing protein n=1 Tax=Roseateles aquae TaxID=3077235 RepID=A0ABU3P7C7_9BURK|nr:hypothetical protein [Paucibacter sp. APW11]MDT8998440.1 hypothetical protein [Paucibacter sp. APW11]